MHLFWRAGEETRLLHVQQLLDAQHHSFSAGLSELLLFVTQGQAEPQVQFGTANTNNRNKILWQDWEGKYILHALQRGRSVYETLLMTLKLIFCSDKMPLGGLVRSRRQQTVMISLTTHLCVITNLQNMYGISKPLCYLYVVISWEWWFI